MGSVPTTSVRRDGNQSHGTVKARLETQHTLLAENEQVDTCRHCDRPVSLPMVQQRSALCEMLNEV